MSAVYYASFLGFAFYLLLILAQWFVATFAKGSQKGAIPGKIDEHLSHDSFVFRSYRTFMNTLENAPLFIGSFFLAVLIGVDHFWVTTTTWVYVIVRIFHMALYYVIATEKNPSPRSYFFMIGFLANVVLLVMCFIRLL
ncbi:MAPEG family protein [Vibrio viridaestus]|uniref:MAPEG family protein n=1 Tax=Vibrio viridaestus TaxID=2487322 RepID=A0A3N9TCI5_9VIBR|nr:MAPEG family protein [Vibrio viridaestus]